MSKVTIREIGGVSRKFDRYQVTLHPEVPGLRAVTYKPCTLQEAMLAAAHFYAQEPHTGIVTATDGVLKQETRCPVCREILEKQRSRAKAV